MTGNKGETAAVHVCWSVRITHKYTGGSSPSTFGKNITLTPWIIIMWLSCLCLLGHPDTREQNDLLYFILSCKLKPHYLLLKSTEDKDIIKISYRIWHRYKSACVVGSHKHCTHTNEWARKPFFHPNGTAGLENVATGYFPPPTHHLTAKKHSLLLCFLSHLSLCLASSLPHCLLLSLAASPLQTPLPSSLLSQSPFLFSVNFSL